MSRIKVINENQIDSLKKEYDSILLNTSFQFHDLKNKSKISQNEPYIENTFGLINRCCEFLKNGGLLFIYGIPKYLLIL